MGEDCIYLSISVVFFGIVFFFADCFFPLDVPFAGWLRRTNMYDHCMTYCGIRVNMCDFSVHGLYMLSICSKEKIGRAHV